jgi:type I restriction enzyme S subunit
MAYMEPTRLPLALSEQKKIAHILSTVQRAIETQERIIQTTTELKKALMHKLFTEGLRNEPQKQTEIGPVPESWGVVELGKVAKIERGKFSHRPRNEPRFYGGKYPFVQTGDVSNCDGYIRSYTQTLNEEGLAISKMFPTGTILITIAANIGFTGILEFDSACPDSLIGISPSERVHTDFLNYYLITQQSEMDRLAPKGTQKNINIQFLKPWPVPLPSIEEQREIAEAFSAVDRKIRLVTKKRNQLQDLFRTLLHELMTAKTRVHELEVAL